MNALYRNTRVGGCLDATNDRRADGAVELRSTEALGAYPPRLTDRLWRAGSASRVARVVVVSEAPSLDKGEVTDKGSINQRAVLSHRAALVEAMYAGTADGLVMPTRC